MLQQVMRASVPRLNSILNICKHSLQTKSISTMPEPATKKYQATGDEALTKALEYLERGQVIALPTDTVYGLACDANNEVAIQRLYAIKGRSFNKPVAICVRDLKCLRMYGEATHLAETLLEQLLPGPITIVLKRSSKLSNKFLNPSTQNIGIRIPDSEFITRLCEVRHEQPLALTSANRSSEPSTLNVDEFNALWPQLGAVIDAGQIGHDEQRRQASTVVDLTTPGRYEILRAGIALESTVKILREFGLKSASDDALS